MTTPADHPRIEGTRSVEYRQGYADGYAKGVQAWTWRDVAILCVFMSTVEFFHDEDSYVERICRWAASEHGVFIPPPEKAEKEGA